MCAYIYSHVVVTDECDVFLVFVRRKHTFLNSTIYSEVLVLSDKQLLRELDVSQHLSSTRFLIRRFVLNKARLRFQAFALCDII